MVSDAPVQVRHGQKIVEVVSSQINKGEAVRRSLVDLGNKLVVCAGDDRTDESMFSLEEGDQILTIKVGVGPTLARYRAADVAAFTSF